MKRNIYHILGIVILAYTLIGCSKVKESDIVSKDPNTTLVLQTIYNSSDQVKSYLLEVYNENKLLIKSLTYSSGKELIIHRDFIYDDGYLNDINEINKKNKLQKEKQYEFDEKGRLLWEHHYNKDHKQLYSYYYLYDKNGNVIEKKTIHPEGIISESTYYTLYEYNLDGTLKSEDFYEGIGETEMTSTIKYIYENGTLVRKEWYVCFGDTYSEKLRSIYIYDEQKRITRIEDYCVETLEGYAVYTYDVDEIW